jgi:hypothetical protein
MASLYHKLSDNFDRHDGGLIGYMRSDYSDYSTHTHYDLRAFHTDDVTLPFTITDMRFWNAFHFTGVTMDALSSTISTAGRAFRKRTMAELETNDMVSYNAEIVFEIENVLIDAGNEEWPATDPDVTVGKNATYKYSNTISVNLTGGVAKTVTSHYHDDILTDFTDDQYFIELVLLSFPAQSAGSHLNLDSSFIDFSSDDNFDPAVTDSVAFNQSMISLTGGGNTTFRINRDILINADLTNLKAIRFRLLSVGNMTFTAQAMRVVPSNFFLDYKRQAYIETKRGVLARQVLEGGADPTNNDEITLFNSTRPINVRYITEFNSGHNPSGNDNQFDLYFRYDKVSNSNLNVSLLSRDTQSRLRLYETIEGVTTEVYSTPINTNILTQSTDYTLVVEVQEEVFNASVYKRDGVFLGDLVYSTGDQTVSLVGRGYLGFNFKPYNYDFTLRSIAADAPEFARFESTPFLSRMPVKGVTIFTEDSGNINLVTSDDTWDAEGDGTLTQGTIGKPVPSDKITRAGNQWLGGLESDNFIFIDNVSQVSIQGDIYPVGQIQGLYRVALLDVNGSVGFIGYMNDLVPDQWNHFDIAITTNITPREYRLLIHQAGFYPGSFYLDNIGIMHNTIGWAASSDSGNTWQRFFYSKDHLYTGINFGTPNTSIKVKATAYSDTAWIAGYELLPFYKN